MNKDKFKAVFMTKGQLNTKYKACADDLDKQIKAAKKIAAEIKQAEVRKEHDDKLDALEQRRLAEVGNGATNPTDAWIALKAMTAEVGDAAKAVTAARDRQDARSKRYGERLEQTRKVINATRAAKREVVNMAEAKRLGTDLDDLYDRVDKVARKVNSVDECQQGYNDLDPLLKEAEKLSKEVESAKKMKAEDGSPRQASKTAVSALKGVPVIYDQMQSKAQNGQGRTPQEDVQARLEVYDEHFARDPGKDPDAQVKNTAMRVATIVSASARAITDDKKINDPNLKPRIARSMVEEYGRDMAQSLGGKGADEKTQRETAKALRVAQALVMDDPVTKLMTGKVSASDAVQRIRDMAKAGGMKPSEMLEMLQQQFEMQIGSLTDDEVRDKKDGGFPFVLNDLYGELSKDQLSNIAELSTKRNTKFGLADKWREDADRPQWDKDGKLELRATAAQAHRVADGDTLASLAETYLGDKKKTAEIVEMNKMVLVPLAKPTPEKRFDEVKLTGLGPDAKLPVGAVLMVPGQSSPLDQLAPYVKAFDKEEDDASGKKANESPEDKGIGKDADESPDLVKPTAKELIEGAKKLTSPKDKNRNPKDKRVYIPSPGLGQAHKLTGTLEDTNAEEREKRLAEKEKRIKQLTALAENLEKLEKSKGKDSAEFKNKLKEYEEEVAKYDASRRDEERDKLHAAINERQYAHLRTLARGDEDDKEQFMRDNGQSVEDSILEKMAARYGVSAGDAKKLLDLAVEWMAKVPLTITFKAENLFSDPTKDEPSHGPVYASEVVYSRDKKDVKELVGRDINVKGEVGVTGGKKTGWEKERGEGYMLWRTEKDDREGRRDYLAHEDQQIFGAANANFEKLKGGDNKDKSGKMYGVNYYGDAHFLLKDEVRSRVAFAVRGGGISIGGGKSANQRKDLMMLFHDMLKPEQEENNVKYLDALLLLAKKKSTTIATGSDWEVHLYGGFDIRKDAKAIYLKPDLDKEVLGRIQRFTSKFGVDCNDYGSKPDGLVVQSKATPKQYDLNK